MSTITKLNPMVRQRRFDSSDLISSLARVAQRLTGFQQVRAIATLNDLTATVRDSRLTGAAKQRHFNNVIKHLEAIS